MRNLQTCAGMQSCKSGVVGGRAATSKCNWDAWICCVLQLPYSITSRHCVTHVNIHFDTQSCSSSK